MSIVRGFCCPQANNNPRFFFNDKVLDVTDVIRVPIPSTSSRVSTTQLRFPHQHRASAAHEDTAPGLDGRGAGAQQGVAGSPKGSQGPAHLDTSARHPAFPHPLHCRGGQGGPRAEEFRCIRLHPAFRHSSPGTCSQTT